MQRRHKGQPHINVLLDEASGTYVIVCRGRQLQRVANRGIAERMIKRDPRTWAN